MRILIVDDDLTSRMMLIGVLQQLGYDACEAASAEEAWVDFAGSNPPHLAIVDWMMPGMTGPELCRKVKERVHKPSPYLILLTSKKNPLEVAQGLDAGADDFLTKPCDPEELRARIGVGLRMFNLQQELCRANEQLEERVAQRTLEIERLLHRAEELLHHLSHDLRTPLTPLLSLLPVLLETEPEAERREMLGVVLSSAQNVATLAARVLELVRSRESTPVLNPEGEDLHRLTEAALAHCRHKHVLQARRLRNEVPTSCRVCADPLQVRQVLAQLLDNAVKFTTPGGAISICATAEGDFIRVAVVDDGIGLDATQLEKVFEPFFKGDPSRPARQAAGLGLSIAKSLVERQGGRIWAESAGLQRGTTFWFALPRPNQT